jgi:hypothetical protein
MRRQVPLVSVLLAASLLSSSLAAGTEIQTVEVTAEVFGHGRTPEHARREALQRARDQAVAEVTGIQIAAQEVTFETRLVDDTPVYRVTLRAEVVLEPGPRDPGFELELHTVPESHTFRAGEAVVLEVSASRPCHLIVLNLDSEGHIGLLFPNEYDGENRIAADERVRLPRPGKPFEIRVEPAGPASPSREQLLVIATLDDVPFALSESTAGELVPPPDSESTLTALNRWLVRIPANRRAEALWDYEVLE